MVTRQTPSLVEGVGRRLAALRKTRDLTQAELAQRLGIRQVNVSYWEKGVRPIPWKWLERIAEVLGIPVEALLSEEKRVEPASPPVQWFRTESLERIPVLGQAHAGLTAYAEVELPPDVGELLRLKNAAAVKVVGTSLCPVAEPGDVLIIEPYWDARPGDLVLVQADGVLAAKRLAEQDGQRLLVSMSGQPLAASEVTLVGKIVLVIHPPRL